MSDLATANVNVAKLVHPAEIAIHVPLNGDGDTIISFDALPIF